MSGRCEIHISPNQLYTLGNLSCDVDITNLGGLKRQNALAVRVEMQDPPHAEILQAPPPRSFKLANPAAAQTQNFKIASPSNLPIAIARHGR